MLRDLFPLLRLCGYLAASLVLGALLAFPAHVALDSVYEGPFDRVFARVVVLTAALLLPFYLRATATSDRNALGFGCSPRAFVRDFVRWLSVGLLVAATLQLAFLGLSVRTVISFDERSPLDVALYLPYALVAGAFIGLVEEAYFRGALLGSLRSVAAWLAVLAVGIVYAAAHFLGSPVPSEDIRWSSGLSSIGRTAFRADAFLALLAAGLLLGAMRLRFGHIAAGAGLHAGFVACIKVAQEFTDVDPHSELAFLAGSLASSMGWLGLLWIVLLGSSWIVWSRIRGSTSRRRRSEHAQT